MKTKHCFCIAGSSQIKCLLPSITSIRNLLFMLAMNGVDPLCISGSTDRVFPHNSSPESIGEYTCRPNSTVGVTVRRKKSHRLQRLNTFVYYHLTPAGRYLHTTCARPNNEGLDPSLSLSIYLFSSLFLARSLPLPKLSIVISISTSV